MFFLDVDRFKVVNDSLGHLAGDELLVGVARRLEQSLRATDTVARVRRRTHAGAPGRRRVHGPARRRARARPTRAAVAERLLAAVAQPFDLQGRDVFIVDQHRHRDERRRATSAPRTWCATPTRRCTTPRRGARRAARSSTPRCSRPSEQRLQLESDLRHALERAASCTSTTSRSWRWRTDACAASRRCCAGIIPTRGWSRRTQFMPVAEETGLIVPIGSWVLREACRQMRAWDAEFPECADADDQRQPVGAAVHARRPGARRRSASSTRPAWPPERLKLEITEASSSRTRSASSTMLNDLRALGVQLGLDDFGTGYSALSYLQRFPFQTLKIDRSFVSGMQARRQRRDHPGHRLAGRRPGDGRDRRRHRDRRAGPRPARSRMRVGQGYFFFKPLTKEDARAVLRSRGCASARGPGSRRLLGAGPLSRQADPGATATRPRHYRSALAP